MDTPRIKLLYEDDDLVFALKPSGLLTEGGGDRELDLERLLEQQIGKRVWCCHRLDRMTSGALLLRKNAKHTKGLSEAFAKRSVRKEYRALVEGEWDKRMQKMETNIAMFDNGIWANVESGGRQAISTFQLLEYSSKADASLVRVLLKTGRTHQARLHCQKAGHPIVGDAQYGGRVSGDLFGLHAYSLKLKHPKTGEALDIKAELPGKWKSFLAGAE